MKRILLSLIFLIHIQCVEDKTNHKIAELEQKIEQQSLLLELQNKKVDEIAKIEETQEVENNLSSLFHKYCNDRFSFCIEYPSQFTPNGDSENRDGQNFTSVDGLTTISAWGNLVIVDINDLDANFNYELNNPNLNVTYKIKKENYFVISGTYDQNVFYRKTILKKINYLNQGSTDVLITWQITYPINQKKTFDSYCEKINNQLR